MTEPNLATPQRTFELPLDNQAILSGDPKRLLDYIRLLVTRLDVVTEQLSTGIYGQTGDWLPVAIGATIAGTGTYEVQVGRYVRVGDLVWFTLNLQFDDANHSGTGNLQITGLPFTSDATTSAQIVCPCWDSQSGATFVGTGIIDPTKESIDAIYDEAGVQQVITADHELHITGQYRVL